MNTKIKKSLPTSKRVIKLPNGKFITIPKSTVKNSTTKQTVIKATQPKRKVLRLASGKYVTVSNKKVTNK